MENKTRRNFMKTLGASIGAAGVFAGGGILSSCNQVEGVEGDKIKVLTAGGKLVEVDVSQLQPAEMPSLSENQQRGRKNRFSQTHLRRQRHRAYNGHCTKNPQG